MNSLLSSKEVAKILNVHINTIRRWSDKGFIKCYKIGPRGDRKFSRESLEAFLEVSLRRT